MKIVARLLLIGILTFILGHCTDKSDKKGNLGIDDKNKMNFSETYEGSIKDKYLIVMKLESKDGILSGNYYYKTQNKEIILRGVIDSADNLKINEFDELGNQTGLFKGRLVDDQISGIWSKPNGSNQMKFVINEIPDTLVRTIENNSSLPKESPQVLGGTSNNIEYFDINSFWFAFLGAIKNNNKLIVTEMTHFPFYDADLNVYLSKNELISNYDFTFDNDMRFMIINAKPGAEITAPNRKSEPNIDYYDGATIKFDEVVEESTLIRYREALKLLPDSKLFELTYNFERDFKTSSHPYQSVGVTLYFVLTKEGYKLYGSGWIL